MMTKGEFAVFVKYHRKRLGLTQYQFARAMKRSRQVIWKWENGQAPDILDFEDIAKQIAGME